MVSNSIRYLPTAPTWTTSRMDGRYDDVDVDDDYDFDDYHHHY
jgi:hypothetical protein